MLLNHFIFNSITLIIYKNCKGINNIAILSKRGQQIKEHFVIKRFNDTDNRKYKKERGHIICGQKRPRSTCKSVT